MLRTLGVGTLEELAAETVPADIRFAGTLDLPAPVDEAAVLGELRALAAKNQIWKSFIGMGYSDCITPPVIQRNILENPGWYTQYTPYQAEISQGRLEALLNFQTMVADLTGLPIANASLLDEGDGGRRGDAHAARAGAGAGERRRRQVTGAGTFFVSDTCHPQTIDVVRTRAKPLGIEVRRRRRGVVRLRARAARVRRAGAVPGDGRRAARLRGTCASARTTRARWSRWRRICWR